MDILPPDRSRFATPILIATGTSKRSRMAIARKAILRERISLFANYASKCSYKVSNVSNVSKKITKIK